MKLSSIILIICGGVLLSTLTIFLIVHHSKSSNHADDQDAYTTNSNISEDSQSDTLVESQELYDYKKLYADYFRSKGYYLESDDFVGQTLVCQDRAYSDFNWIYLDDDDIPELVLFGNGECNGTLTLSAQRGKVEECSSSRLEISYIPRSGLICEEYLHMGVGQRIIYRLDCKFKCILEMGFRDDWDEEGNNFVRYYGMGDNEITKKEFDSILDKAYYSKGKPLYPMPDDYDSNNRRMSDLCKELGL